jgi:alkylation response protein AidB-like acyl-CoA dehydrogenase
MSIAENFRAVTDRVASAAIRAGRDPQSVRIISVSKTFPAENIQEAIDSGISLFGENRIQEAKNKIPMLKGDFVFHDRTPSVQPRPGTRWSCSTSYIPLTAPGRRNGNREAEKAGKTLKILFRSTHRGGEQKRRRSGDALRLVSENFRHEEHTAPGTHAIGAPYR